MAILFCFFNMWANTMLFFVHPKLAQRITIHINDNVVVLTFWHGAAFMNSVPPALITSSPPKASVMALLGRVSFPKNITLKLCCIYILKGKTYKMEIINCCK